MVIAIPPINVDRNRGEQLIITGAYIAAESMTNAGVPTTVFDFQNDPDVNLQRLVQSIEPSTLLGISATVVSYSWTRELVAYLHRNIPEEKRPLIIAGGSLASSNPQEILELGVDIVIRGEVDAVMSQLIQALQTGDFSSVPGVAYLNEAGETVQTRPVEMPGPDAFELADLDALRHLQPVQYFPLQLTRGCPFYCDSCGVAPDIASNRVRRMRPEQVREVLVHLSNDFSFEILGIKDNDFLQNPVWARTVAEMLNELGIKWTAIVKADDKKIAQHLPYMATNGLIGVDLDIESIHPELHRANNLFRSTLVHRDYMRAVRIVQGMCSNTTITVKTGWRGETMQQLLEVGQFILELQHHVSEQEAESLADGVLFTSDRQKRSFLQKLSGKRGEVKARYWDIRPAGYPGSKKAGAAIKKGREIGHLPSDARQAAHKYLEYIGWYLVHRFEYDDPAWFMIMDMCNAGSVPTATLAQTIQRLDDVATIGKYPTRSRRDICE